MKELRPCTQKKGKTQRLKDSNNKFNKWRKGMISSLNFNAPLQAFSISNLSIESGITLFSLIISSKRQSPFRNY